MLILFGIAAGVLVVLTAVAVAHRMTHPDRRTYGSALARGIACEPSELGLVSETREFQLTDGTSTSAWVIEGGSPNGPTVILTHGWSSSRYWSLTKAPRFAPYAARVVVYDMRGHGDATGPISTLGVKEPGDLIQIMNELDRDANVELENVELETDSRTASRTGSESASERARFVLQGSSMGAGITLQAAVSDFAAGRNRIQSVMVEGPYRHAMGPVALHLKRLGWPAQPATWLAHLIVYFTLGAGSVKGQDGAGQTGANVGGGYDRVGLASRLRCPLFVLHGTDDPICPVSGGREIAEAAEVGHFVEFPGGGHGGLFHLDPARYDAALIGAMTGRYTESVVNPA